MTGTGRNSRIATMVRSLLRWLAPVLLAAMLGGHVTELFDHWDRTLQTGRDVDYTVVWIAACFGVAFAVTREVVSFFRRHAKTKTKTSLIGQCLLPFEAIKACTLGPSPPPLLLPLRI